jgi:hypothetical protein
VRASGKIGRFAQADDIFTIFRRLNNLDVDIAVSGFTKEQKNELEEVSSLILA